MQNRFRETILRNPSRCDHAAYLYPDAGSLCDALASYVEGALERDEAAVVIATEEHGDGLMARLERSGHDGRGLLSSGRVVRLEAVSVLGRIMRGRDPDAGVFDEVVMGALRPALERFSGVRAYGELVDVLCQEGNLAAADCLEGWWNGLIEQQGFSLLCGYREDVMDGSGAGVRAVCRRHSHLIPAEPEQDLFAGAVEAALGEVFEDPGAMRTYLAERYDGRAEVPPGHAALMTLGELLPLVAERVRLRARSIYGRLCV